MLQEKITYCDEPGVELLDSWCVDIPNASKENRAYEFTLTFGKVEIEAIAQAKTEIWGFDGVREKFKKEAMHRLILKIDNKQIKESGYDNQ
ncbi:unnamed protein product [Rhizophagus irregularis]|nr:unnamed protein product [Rhizophagus irregularis]